MVNSTYPKFKRKLYSYMEGTAKDFGNYTPLPILVQYIYLPAQNPI